MKEKLKNRKLNNLTYRECFGFENPPTGTKLNINHHEGIGFYIVWNECPDNENIIEGWFKTRNQAEAYLTSHGWVL
jgi:hypothetical protein